MLAPVNKTQEEQEQQTPFSFLVDAFNVIVTAGGQRALCTAETLEDLQEIKEEIQQELDDLFNQYSPTPLGNRPSLKQKKISKKGGSS